MKSPKMTTLTPLARLALLAPLARMPRKNPPKRLTYRKKAKDAKRAKKYAASTNIQAVRGATYATLSILTGASWRFVRDTRRWPRNPEWHRDRALERDATRHK